MYIIINKFVFITVILFNKLNSAYLLLKETVCQIIFQKSQWEY